MPRRLTSWESQLDRDCEREPSLLTERQDPPRTAQPLHERCNLIWCTGCRSWADECACIEVIEVQRPVSRAYTIRVERATSRGIVSHALPFPFHATSPEQARKNAYEVFGTHYPRRAGWLWHALEVAS